MRNKYCDYVFNLTHFIELKKSNSTKMPSYFKNSWHKKKAVWHKGKLYQVQTFKHRHAEHFPFILSCDAKLNLVYLYCHVFLKFFVFS